MINMEKELMKIGLTEYEAKTYVALLRLGIARGPEISKESGVPKTRIYDVLKILANKGLIEIVEERPMVFKAVKPEVGIKQLLKKKIEDMKKTETNILGSLSKIKTKPKLTVVQENVFTALGYEKMYSFSSDWYKEAKKEISIFSVGEEIPHFLRRAIIRAVKRGVNCRLIVTKCDEENINILKKHAESGMKLRYYPSTGRWTFAIFDKKRVMINVRNPKIKEERFSIFFEIPEFAKSLNEYYEMLWKKSKQIKL